MKQHLGFTKRFLLLVTPVIASSALASSPSQAATFASSQGVLEFTNFSQSPVRVGTSTDANTVAIANGGMVQALANAEANFIVIPPTASSSSLSKALGESRDYLGLAQSQSRVIGNFEVDAGNNFSFDFTTALNLETSIDKPPAENARASGDISFLVVDTSKQANPSILDFFSIVGNLITLGDNDFIASQQSTNITLTNQSSNSTLGGNQEFIQSSLSGSLTRYFATKTNLTLIEVNTTQARVTASEPAMNLALLFASALLGIGLKAQRKGTASRTT